MREQIIEGYWEDVRIHETMFTGHYVRVVVMNDPNQEIRESGCSSLERPLSEILRDLTKSSESADTDSCDDSR